MAYNWAQQMNASANAKVKKPKEESLYDQQRAALAAQDDMSSWKRVGQGVFGTGGETAESLMTSILGAGDRDATYERVKNYNPSNPGVAAAVQNFVSGVDEERAAAAQMQAAMNYGGSGGRRSTGTPGTTFTPENRGSRYSIDTTEYNEKINYLKQQIRQAERTGVGDIAYWQDQLAQVQADKQAALEKAALAAAEDSDYFAETLPQKQNMRESSRGQTAPPPSTMQTPEKYTGDLAALQEQLYIAQGQNDQGAIEELQRQIAKLGETQQSLALKGEIDTFNNNPYSGMNDDELNETIDYLRSRISLSQYMQMRTFSDSSRQMSLDERDANVQVWRDEEKKANDALQDALAIKQMTPEQRERMQNLSDTAASLEEAQDAVNRAGKVYNQAIDEYDAAKGEYIEAGKEYSAANAEARYYADMYKSRVNQLNALVSQYNAYLKNGADSETLQMLYDEIRHATADVEVLEDALQNRYDVANAAAQAYMQTAENHAEVYNDLVGASGAMDVTLGHQANAFGRYYDAINEKESLPSEYKEAYENYLGLGVLIDGYEDKIKALRAEDEALIESGGFGSSRSFEIEGEIDSATKRLRELKEEYAKYLNYGYAYDLSRTMAEMSAEELDKFKTISKYLGSADIYDPRSDLATEARQYETELRKLYGNERYSKMLDMVEREEGRRAREEQQKKIQNMGVGESIVASLGSVITNLVSAPGVLAEIAVQSLDNVDAPINTNATGFRMQNLTRDIRGTIGQKIEQDVLNAGGTETQAHWASVGYSTVLSGIDSLLAMVTGNAIGSSLGLTGEALSQVGGYMLGATAASNSMEDIIERGGNLEDAVVGGIVSGVFECLFETWSIENFKGLQESEIKNGIKDVLGNLAKSAATNFSEEFNTEVANIGYDILSGALGMSSDWQDRFEELKGVYRLTDSQAYKVIASEIVTQAWEAGVSGALMGVGLGALSSIRPYKNYLAANDAFKSDFDARLKNGYAELLKMNGELLPEYEVTLPDPNSVTTFEQLRETALQIQKAAEKQNAEAKQQSADANIDPEVQAKAQELSAVNVKTNASIMDVNAQAEAGTEAGLADAQNAQAQTDNVQEDARIAQNDVSRETAEDTAQDETAQPGEAQAQGETDEQAYGRYTREQAQAEIDAIERGGVEQGAYAQRVEDRIAEVRREGREDVADAMEQIVAERSGEAAQTEQTVSPALPGLDAQDRAYIADAVEEVRAGATDRSGRINAAAAQDIAANLTVRFQTAGQESLIDTFVQEVDNLIAGGNENAVYSDEGGERNARAYPAGESGRVESGAGETGGANETAESEGGRYSAAQSGAGDVGESEQVTGKAVRMTELSKHGKAGATVNVINDTTTDPRHRALLDKADADGINLRLVDGPLTFTVDGKDFIADGFIDDDGTITINVSSADFTPEQLYDHEKFHSLVAANPGLLDEIRRIVENRYDEVNGRLRDVLRLYKAAYAGAGSSYLYIAEELCADCYAGMNRFAYGQTALVDEVRAAVDGYAYNASAASGVTQGNAQQENHGEFRYSTRGEVLKLKGVNWTEDNSRIRKQLQDQRDVIAKAFPNGPIVEIDYGGESEIALENLIMEQAYKIAGRESDGNGVVFNRDGVTFEFDKNACKKIREHASSDEALKAAAILSPYVANNGVLIAGHKNHEGHAITTLTYAAPVRINGTIVNEGVVIQFTDDGIPKAVNVDTSDGGRFIIKKEETAERNRGRSGSNPATTPPRGAASDIRILQNGTDVKGSASSPGNIIHFSATESHDDLTSTVEAGYQTGEDAKAPTMEDKAASEAASETLKDRERALYAQALADRNSKLADLLHKQWAAEDKAKELYREANMERAAYQADGNVDHLARAAELQKQAKSEHAKANRLSKQTNLPVGKWYEPKRAVRNAVDTIMKSFKVKSGMRAQYRAKLSDLLNDIYRKGKVEDADIFRIASELADDSIDYVATDPVYDAVYNEYLKNAHIYVDEGTRAEFGDSWDDFRRYCWSMGIYLTSNAQDRSADSYYNELSESVSRSIFDEDVTDGAAQLQIMADAAKLGQPRTASLVELAQEDGVTSEEFYETLFEEVLDAVYTFADQANLESQVSIEPNAELMRQRAHYEARIERAEERSRAARDAQEQETRERIADIRESEQQKRNELRERLTQEGRDMRDEAVARERQKRDEMLEKFKQHVKDVNQNAKERRQRSEAMQKIRKELNMISRRAKVNEENYTRMISQQDDAVRERMEDAYSRLNGIATSMVGYDVTNPAQLAGWLEDYRGANADFDSAHLLDDAVNALAKIKDWQKMSVEDLALLSDVLTAIDYALNTANKMIGEEWDSRLDETAEQMRGETEKAKGSRLAGRKNTDALVRLGYAVNEEALSYSRNLKRYGSWDPNSVMYKFAEAFERGDMKYMNYKLGADMVLQPFLNRRNNAARRNWLYSAAGEDAKLTELTFPAAQAAGRGDAGPSETVKVNVNQMQLVQMYLDLRNEDNLRHIQYGGYTFPDAELYNKGKRKSQAYTKDYGITVKMTKEQIQDIVDKHLASEGKEFAELLDRYYNVYAKPYINATSRTLEGRDKAVNEHYYPIRIDKNYNADSYNFYNGVLENMGPLKERIAGANNAIYLCDADETFQWHKELMAKYVGYAIPLRDIKTVLNYAPHHDEVTNRAVLNSKFSENAGKFIDSFYKVLESNQFEDAKSLTALLGNYVSNVLNANISSMLKQFAALPLAGSTYGMEPILYAVSHLHKGVDLDLVRKYTAYLDERADEFTYDQITDIVRKKAGSAGKVAWQTALGRNWLTATDYAANKVLWIAAEHYVDTHTSLQPGTEADIKAGKDPYYQKVAEVFNRMTFDTQTNANTMAKPNILRHVSGDIKALTLFKTDQFQRIGILREAFGQNQWAQENGTEADKRNAMQKVYHAVQGVIASSVVQAAMAMVAKVLRRKDDDLKDEDGSYDWKKIGKTVGIDTFTDVLGCLIVAEEVYNMIAAVFDKDKKWYGIEAPALDAINDLCSTLVNQLPKVFDAINTARGEGGAEWLSNNSDKLTNPLMRLARDITRLTGFPLSNIEKNLFGLLGWVWPEAAVGMSDLYTAYAKTSLTGKKGKELEASVRAYLSDEVGRFSDEAMKEYARLYEQFGSDALPGFGEPKVYDEDGNERKMTADETKRWDSAYRETMIDLVNDIVASDAYKAMTDDEKKSYLEGAESYAKVAAKSAIGIETSSKIQDGIDAGTDPAYAILCYDAMSSQSKHADKFLALDALDIPDEQKAAYFHANYPSTAKEWAKAAEEKNDMEFLDFARSKYGSAEQEETAPAQTQQTPVPAQQTQTDAEAVPEVQEQTEPAVDPEKEAKYQAAAQAGLSEDGARAAVDAVTGIDADKARDRQSAAVHALDSVDDQLAAVRYYADKPDADYARFDRANEYGVTPSDFFTFWDEVLEKIGNSPKQVNVQELLDARDDLTQEEKAVLWQLCSAGWAARNNPYAAYIGEQIKEAYDTNK